MVHTGENKLAQRVAAVVRRHQLGDSNAMGELYQLVGAWLRRVAMTCRLSPHSADDVVQTTIEAALVHLPKLRDPDAGLAWLTVIARREAIRVSREERRVDLLGDKDVTGVDTVDPERMMLAAIARQNLQEALGQLPEKQRKLLTFLFLDEARDYASIASELDMPVGSIGPTRQRGLRKVRFLLDRDDRGVDPGECPRCA